MKKIYNAIRCAYAVSVVINRVSIKFNREDTADDFMLGDQSFPYWKVSALANAASNVHIETSSLQIDLYKEGKNYSEKVVINRDGSEYVSLYDAEKEVGYFRMTRKGVTVRKDKMPKNSFVDWVEEFGLNYYGIK